MQNEDSTSPTSGWGAILRLHWMLLGTASLIILALYMSQCPSERLIPLIVVFWCVVLTQIAARYIDVRFMRGETADGKPATIRDWIRYSLVLSGVSLAACAIIAGIRLFSSGR